MNGFRIDKVDIEGFRGYCDEQSINFNCKSTFILGGNYCGKSSTLGAIEWCLFGDFTSIPTNVSVSKKRDEFVNDKCNEIKVALYLSRDNDKIKVSRTKKRNFMKTNLSMTDNEGNDFKDEDAEKRLFQIIGLNLDDFIRSVYLHQESIRFLLTEDPLERNTALDRLFGLDYLTNILENVPMNKIKDEINEFSEKIVTINNNLEFRLRENMVTLDEVKKKALDNKIKSENLSITHASDLSKEIYDSLSEISKEQKVEIVENKKIASLDDISSSIASFKEKIGEIRRKLFDHAEIDHLNKKKHELTELQSNYSCDLETYNEEKKGLDSFIKENGDDEKIEAVNKKARDKIKEIEAEKTKLGIKQKMMQDALQFFNDYPINKCPICQSDIDLSSVKKHLQEEMEKQMSDELNNLNIQQKEQEAIEKKCVENQYLLSKIQTRCKKAEKTLKETIAEINKKMDKKIDEKTDVIFVLKTELIDITLQVEKLSAPLKKKDEVLQISEQKLDNLKLLYDYLISKERQKLLMELQNKKELKNAAKTIAELSEFQDMVKTIIRCIQEVQVDSASSMIGKASTRINEIYNEIVNHPYYTELTIEVQPSIRRGTAKNNYFIKGLNRTEGLETLAGERFSTGHMNCVALAIYLAMSETKILNHKLNFLIIDDPSQNLDENHMQSLAKILNNISSQSQLIISTQDPSFTPILSTYLKDPSIIKLKFDKWDCKTGPSFQYADKI